MSKVSKKLERFVQCDREELSQEDHHKELDKNKQIRNSMNTNESLIKENVCCRYMLLIRIVERVSL
jgi:hypothetical protein